MRWLLIVCLLSTACSKTDPELSMRADRLEADLATARSESQAAQQTIDGLKQEIRNLLDENRQLTDRMEAISLESGAQRVAQLERELATAQSDAAKYREGLEKAVATLNKQEQKHQLDQYLSSLEERQSSKRPSSRSGSSNARASTECCVKARTPYVSHVERSVLVSGDVKNSRSTDAYGEVVIELLDGSSVVDTQSVRLTIPAGLDDSYEVSFDGVQSTGKYRARARWEDL